MTDNKGLTTDNVVTEDKPLPPRKPLPVVEELAPRVRKDKKGNIVVRDKLEIFLEEFLKNGGNASKAAMKISKAKTMNSAALLGSYYLKKAKALGRIYMEEKGYGYGKLLDVAIEKMVESGKTDWWDRLMKVSEYHDFVNKETKGTPVNVNILQTHKNLTSKYIEGEESTETETSEEEEETNED